MLAKRYKTIKAVAKGPVFKDRKSKFMGFAFPVHEIAEIEYYKGKLRQDHPGARHHCYAWQTGIDNVRQKANDDGEPHNSAGQPILGQIRAFGLTEVLVVVVRYYGGTKLGVGGLVNAYRTAARYVLEEAVILEKELSDNYSLCCSHAVTGKVLHIIKKNQWEIISQEVKEDFKIMFSVRVSETEKMFSEFSGIPFIDLEKVEQD